MSQQPIIHPSAVVDHGATIGDNTKIWHFCHIMSGAIIEENCSLGQNVFVANNVRIGRNSKIQNNVSVYDGVTLEEGVFLGPSMVFTNVDVPRATIERKNYLKTHVRKGASIGANATIVCGTTIGEYAFIGAGAVVTKDVPNFALIYGVPAVHQGWVSKAGRRLQFDSDGRAFCPEMGDAYELRSGQVFSMER
jgi:UDP-2-acetamido-3-amino-2,3-dideoxy-glucuronate N-acetyltransferase